MSKLPDKNKPIDYPALLWYEFPSGNVAPVYVMRSDKDYTEHFWGKTTQHKDGRFVKVGDINKISEGSQSNSRRYFLEKVTEEQISDLLARAENNQV